MGEWGFADSEETTALTVRQIAQEGTPVLLVSRDPEGGTWQFLTGGPFEMADALLVSLGSVLRLDPSLREVSDLGVGWSATRLALGQPWTREPPE